MSADTAPHPEPAPLRSVTSFEHSSDVRVSLALVRNVALHATLNVEEETTSSVSRIQQLRQDSDEPGSKVSTSATFVCCPPIRIALVRFVFCSKLRKGVFGR